jgi:hypothetical protein
MFRTLSLSALGLLLAAGGPAAIYWGREYVKNGNLTAFIPGSAKESKASTKTSAPKGDFGTEAPPIVDIGDALRFDLAPAWVIQRWPRVSTGMGQVQMQGYRVALVTGTSEHDLAGSLTYYFNPRQQLQRIVFYGTTGDPGKLVAFLSARYGFARRILNDPGLFVYEVPGSGAKPSSFLQMQSFDIIKHSDPLKKFKVSFVIERPENT